MHLRKRLVLYLILAAWAFPCSAAPITAKDVQAITNSLKYVRGLQKTSGSLAIAAIYDPANAASRADAENFVALVSAAATSKAGTQYQAELVNMRDFPAHDRFTIAYIAMGISTRDTSLATLTQQRHLFTIGRDPECATTGACILAVDTSGAVDIYLNEQAMRAGGFDVDAAFKFMVKSI